MKNRRRAILIALIWASLQLICPQARTAFAGVAEIHVAADGAATATVDGVAIAPFRLAITHHTLSGGDEYWQITQAPPNGPLWCGGITAGSLWCDLSCRVGWFNRWTYPPPALGHGEPIGYSTVLDGYGLDGAAVNVSREGAGGAGFFIQISEPPPVRSLDLFAFLEGWFAGDAAVGDWNRDGAVGVQDLFDFLAALLG